MSQRFVNDPMSPHSFAVDSILQNVRAALRRGRHSGHAPDVGHRNERGRRANGGSDRRSRLFISHNDTILLQLRATNNRLAAFLTKPLKSSLVVRHRVVDDANSDCDDASSLATLGLNPHPFRSAHNFSTESLAGSTSTNAGEQLPSGRQLQNSETVIDNVFGALGELHTMLTTANGELKDEANKIRFIVDPHDMAELLKSIDATQQEYLVAAKQAIQRHEAQKVNCRQN